MAAEERLSCAGRPGEADRNSKQSSTRHRPSEPPASPTAPVLTLLRGIGCLVALVAVLALVALAASRQGRLAVLAGLVLQLPLLIAAVMVAGLVRGGRSPRPLWRLVLSAAALAGVGDLAFLGLEHRWLRPGVLEDTLWWVNALAGLGAEVTLGLGVVLLLICGSRSVVPAGIETSGRNRFRTATGNGRELWSSPGGGGWGRSGVSLDLAVALAGAITYALVVAGVNGRGAGWLPGSVQLAVATMATLVVVHVVIEGGARDRLVLTLVAAMVLHQIALLEQVLVLGGPRRPLEPRGLGPALVGDPRVAWLAFAAALAMAAALGAPARSSSPRWVSRAHRVEQGRRPSSSGEPGSWAVPALCMTFAAGALVWTSRQDGPRPAALVWWAAATLALGLVRTVWSGRDLRRLGALVDLTNTDELSGLLHRRAITAALARATTSGPGSLLIIDVDRFRDINHYLGHEAADDVLRQLGARLSRHAGPHERLGRLGADEFALITPAVAPATAMAVARRVRDLVEIPFQVGGDLVRVDLSVGIVSWAEHPPRVDQLLSQAHEARRLARERGVAIERWDPERDAMATRRLALADSLRRSVRREELLLHYQPKVHIGTGEVLGVEALARWNHEGEMISPELFISMAEEAGLIASLTRALLDQALSQLARWNAQGLPLTVAVNLSPRNLLDPALPRLVTQLLQRHAIPARQLMLEITETTLMPDRSRSVEVLERLRGLGVGLSIDDYGTGNAALSYLRDFSVDELKLDRSYVAAMVSDERTYAIVHSTVAMGRQLGLTVVAEGVERIEEVDALTRCGCEIIQGYLVCRPLPAAELTAWLHEREALRADRGISPRSGRGGGGAEGTAPELT